MLQEKLFVWLEENNTVVEKAPEKTKDQLKEKSSKTTKTKPNKEKFYDDHMPHLEDENKIYGDRGAGAPGNPWMDVLGVGLDIAGAAAGAGAFDGGGSSDLPAGAAQQQATWESQQVPMKPGESLSDWASGGG